MKIKIMDDFVHEYEDISLGKLYEVVEEHPDYYIILDDQFDDNTIFKEHCEIITEEDTFKKGDRVKVVVKDTSDSRLIEKWALYENVNKVGEIVELNPDGEPIHSVNFVGDSEWYVPVELLQKDPITTTGATEEVQQSPSLQQIIQFTQNNKGFNVSIEDGNMTLVDWSNDPGATFYRPKTIEEMLELMELLEKINEYKFDNE